MHDVLEVPTDDHSAVEDGRHRHMPRIGGRFGGDNAGVEIRFLKILRFGQKTKISTSPILA